MSLDVTMPTSLLPILPVSVTGIPEKPWRILASNTSPTVCRGLITTGSVMKPCSNFWWEKTAMSEIKSIQCGLFQSSYPNILTLTLRTSLAWNSAVQLWWIIPIPPINWKEDRGKIWTTFETVSWRQADGTKQMLRCLCALLLLTAMAMAMDDSVTVSMGDEMRGVFRVIFLVNAEVRSSNLNAFGGKKRQDFMTLKDNNACLVMS